MSLQKLKDCRSKSIQQLDIQFVSSVGLPLLHDIRLTLSGCPVVYVIVVLQYVESPSGIIISVTGLNTTLLPETVLCVTGGCDPWTARLASPYPIAGLQCEATAVWGLGCGLRAGEREPPVGADSVLCHSFCLAQHGVPGEWLM